MSTSATETSTRTTPHEGTTDAAYLCVSVEGHRLEARGARFELSANAEVVVGKGAKRGRVAGPPTRLEVPDPKLSRSHCSISRRFGTWTVVDLESKNGTFLNGTRTQRSELTDGDVLRLGSSLVVFRDGFPPEQGDLDLAQTSQPPGVLTLVPSLAARFSEAQAVVAADIPLLITGPTGTGKELLARALHASLGRSGPLVPVNCGALPAELIESELFGHQRGAFSGSHQDHAGLLVQADGGTLFLDEVGELPLGAQAKLLRAVEERIVRPVGGTRSRTVDIRLISATHRALPAMVAGQGFREDLYARIAGFELELPKLEERREDFGAFLALALAGQRSTISGTALEALCLHAWSGGGRALAHAVRASAALSGLETIRDVVLPAAPTAQSTEPTPSRSLSTADHALRDELLEACRRCDGNLAEVARQMGKDRKQIRRWVARLGLADLVDGFRKR